MSDTPLSERVFFEFMSTQETARQDRVKEQDRRHEELVTAVTKVSDRHDVLDARVDDHGQRLVVVEGTRRNLRWVIGAGLTGAIGFLFDFFRNHKP